MYRKSFVKIAKITVSVGVVVAFVLGFGYYIYNYNDLYSGFPLKQKFQTQTIKLKSDGTVFFNYDPKLNKPIDESNIKKIVIDSKKDGIYSFGGYGPITKAFNSIGIQKSIFLKNANVIYKYQYGKNLGNVLSSLNEYQRYNHFPYFGYLTNKGKLWKEYNKMRELYPKEYNFMPESYLLPEDKESLVKNFNKHKLWIVKPQGLSRGRGIKIINSVDDIPKYGIASEYIIPHLIFDRKYNFRLFILVTSVDPLCFYLHGDGYVTFTSKKWTDDEDFIDDNAVHLNHSYFNKDKKGFRINNQYDVFSLSRSSFYSFEKYCSKNNIDFPSIKKQIQDICVKAVLSNYCSEIKKFNKYVTSSSKNVYEIFGVDVCLDNKLKPYLLEINLAPDIEPMEDSPIDLVFFDKMVTDLFNLVGIKPYDHKNTKRRVLNFEERLQENLDELKRERGGWELIFPLRENIDKYKKFIKDPSELNLALWKEIQK